MKRTGGTRACIECGEVRTIEGHGKCKPCWGREYYQRSKEKVREGERSRRQARTLEEVREANLKTKAWRQEWRLKRYYNMTQADYDDLLEQQGGGCAICHQECKSGKRLAVDHDHRCCPGTESCGKCVRGLLCYRCNSSLGFMDEDVERIKAMVHYLERIEKLDKKAGAR